MNVFGRRILSTPRVLARFSSTTTVVPPHPPASATPTFATETAVSDYPQAPNYPGLWSENQRPRPTPATGPRFEQTAMQLQPQPPSAMEMIAREPIRLSNTRIAACDGGAYRAFHSHVSRSPSPSLPHPRYHNSGRYPASEQYTDSSFLYRTGGGPLGHPKIFINLVRP
jgi:NADH dehydrogenase (ubiquinone) Fe-S protein 6